MLVLYCCSPDIGNSTYYVLVDKSPSARRPALSPLTELLLQAQQWVSQADKAAPAFVPQRDESP